MITPTWQAIGIWTLIGILILMFIAILARILFFIKIEQDPWRALTQINWFDRLKAEDKAYQEELDQG